MRRLYEGGISSDNMRGLFSVIDFLIRLPPESARRFRVAHHQIEEELNVKVLTQSEELAMAEGREEGREEGLEEGLTEGRIEGIVRILKVRFRSVPDSLPERLRLFSAATLRALGDAAENTDRLETFLSSVDAVEPDSE